MDRPPCRMCGKPLGDQWSITTWAMTATYVEAFGPEGTGLKTHIDAAVCCSRKCLADYLAAAGKEES